nr:MAG TPA: hypothetical protein [Caudoviricetes sp.]
MVVRGVRSLSLITRVLYHGGRHLSIPQAQSVSHPTR